jgi:hypothetical protein
MKKFTIFALAALLLFAFTAPAWATEHEFSGSWRNRFYQKNRYTGTKDANTREFTTIDQRVQIQYAAIVNDNLKLITKFEIDAVWGAQDAAPGTDGVDIEVARVYVDFNLTPNLNIKTGYQLFYLVRGYLISDDAAGIIATYKVNPGLAFVFVWVHMADDPTGPGPAGNAAATALALDVTDVNATSNDMDIDLYAIMAVVALSKNVVIKPMYAFVHSQAGYYYADAFGDGFPNYFLNAGMVDNMNIHIVSLDVDVNLGNFSWYMTVKKDFGYISLSKLGVGTVQALANASKNNAPDVHRSSEVKMDGFLFVTRAAYNFGMFDIHAKFMFASGDDQYGLADAEMGANYTTPVNFSYWAQIMGRGTFDGSNGQGGYYFNNISANSPAHNASNLWYIQVGTNIKPMDKLTIEFDFFYAELAEDRGWQDSDGDWHAADELGFEVDVTVKYQIIEGLNLDLVAAYLFRDDGTYMQTSGPNGTNTAGWNGTRFDAWEEGDPWLLGARLSLAF